MKSASPVSQYLMIGSVASQFSCCFSSREQKHKCKSKKIAHSRPDGYLHNATWVLEVSKIFELASQKTQKPHRVQPKTSEGIKRYHMASKDKKRQQMASKVINWYLSTSKGIKWPQKSSKSIKGIK